VQSGAGGIRPPVEKLAKSVLSSEGGAESGPIEPLSATVVAAWPELPEAIKAGILAIVKAASGRS
jgi:hypothetical protein